MGYKYDEGEILAAAVEAVLDEGLSKLNYGRLAARLGIADRSIVYYFPTKADLVTRTVFALGGRFQALLEDAFGVERLQKDELLRRAWPVLTTPYADRVFAVFFELVGLSAAKISPFDALAPTVMEAWIGWLVPRIDAPESVARAQAYSIVAMLDGLLILRLTAGAEAADGAAQALGVTDS